MTAVMKASTYQQFLRGTCVSFVEAHFPERDKLILYGLNILNRIYSLYLSHKDFIPDGKF